MSVLYSELLKLAIWDFEFSLCLMIWHFVVCNHVAEEDGD